MNKKRVLSAALAAMMTVAPASASVFADGLPIDRLAAVIAADEGSAVWPFSDVSAEDACYEAVDYVYRNHLMYGLEEDLFGPADSLTRAMLVTVLYRMEGEPAFMNDCVFSDVESGAYYEKAVVWAQGKGVVAGVSETEFAPDDNVTREQMAAIIHRYLKDKGVDLEAMSEETNTLSFDDIDDMSEWARPSLHVCLATGILLPVDGKILPQEEASRADVAWALMAADLMLEGQTAEAPVEIPDYLALAGEYMDSVSGRASMEAVATEDGLQLKVHWANSASEAYEWTMNAAFVDATTLAYTDCLQEKVTADETGESVRETVSENGAGFFTYQDGALLWDGAEEENCRECLFEQENAGVPNPVVATNEQGLMDQLGVKFGVPEGAKDVSYAIIDGTVAQMDFTLDGVSMTARICPAPEYTDISGLYLDWTEGDACNISGIDGSWKAVVTPDGTATALCLWFDEAPGLMYSLSGLYPSAENASDLEKVASQVYLPVQKAV